MAIIRKSISKKSKDNDDMIHEYEGLEKCFNQLKENIFFSQQLVQTGSWTRDIQKDEILLTDEVYDILECSPQFFDGKLETYYLYVHPNDLEKVKKAYHDALEGKDYDMEYRIITGSGKDKYVREKTKVLCDENNNTIKIVGIIQDITKYKLLENNLKMLGEDLNQGQRVAGVGIWKYDFRKDRVFWSEEMYHIFGIEPADFVNDFQGTIKLIHPKDRIKLQDALKAHLAGESCKVEYRILQNDGTVKFVVSKGEPLFDNTGEVVGILGAVQDITEKKLLQEEVQKKIEEKHEEINKLQRRFQVLMQKSGNVFLIVDPDGVIKYINPTVKRILGYTVEELVNRSILDFFEEKEKSKLTYMMESVLIHPDLTIQNDLVIKTKAGEEVFLELNMSNQLIEPSIQGIAINLRDITPRKRLERRMAYNAAHDELTGLPNRSNLKKQILAKCKQSEEKRASFALMMLNIDEFKYINDSLGYELGDKLIVQITERLKTLLDDEKLVCRYSEDQFAIIVQGFNTVKEYESFAERLAGLFSQTFKAEKYEMNMNVNIGISIYPRDGQDAELLIKYANLALLWAKNDGKNKYRFYSSDIYLHDIYLQNFKQFKLRNDLRTAIQNHQLKVYYQPIVNLNTGEILAAEALIRWEHPEWGIVMPNEFIPLAEETGFIIDIGSWLLRKICSDYKQWISCGLPAIKISVNFSNIQFYENNFVENIKNTIDGFQLDPHFLIMDITENVLIKKANNAIPDIRRLQSFGIQIALDNFGTGFSSLSCLSLLNIDILKIDKPLIKNILIDEANTIIAGTIINMAQKLGIKLVAEGVETWKQLSYLRKMKCYAGQGYLYSKPVPMNEFEKILGKMRCKPIQGNCIEKLAYKEA